MPQMFVVPMLFNHYPLVPRGAMRPKAHSVLTVYAPSRLTRRPVLECGLMGARRVVGVSTRSTGAVAMVVAGMAVSLSGCDDTAKWFAKPLNPFNNNPGYNYSSLGDARVDRAITANDLVDAGGACPNYAGPAPNASASPGEGASPQDSAALFGGGVALGMSECDIVARLGQATAVNFGTGAYGSRSVVLTYNAGPRPGIYRFENGRLLEMDRVEGLPPSAEKKATKKKPAKSGEAKSGDGS
jgi:hypothetical protein